MINDLPDEIILHILYYLPLKDLRHLFQVNRTFSSLSSDEPLWKEYLKRDYPTVPLPNQCSYRELYQHWHHYKFGKAKVIKLPKTYYSYHPALELICQQTNSNLDSRIYQYLKNGGEGIQCGDIIYLSETEYEHGYERSLIFDGSHVIKLDYKEDNHWYDDPVIPPSFEVIKEFPIDYWEKCFNDEDDVEISEAVLYYVYCDLDSYIEEILHNIKPIWPKRGYKSTFQYWTGCVYHIMILTETLPPEDKIREKLQLKMFEFIPYYWIENSMCRCDNTLTLPFKIKYDDDDNIWYE